MQREGIFSNHFIFCTRVVAENMKVTREVAHRAGGVNDKDRGDGLLTACSHVLHGNIMTTV